MGAANDILSRYQHIVRSLTFMTGSKGVFDVTVDGQLIYSKAETGRHAEPGEVLDLFVEKHGQGVVPYGHS
ncbi:MAG TPA: Rdx family protein [Acidimicrobiia bacterium]|nr:Rdx family protein [Acidimicrobiia bacterium]